MTNEDKRHPSTEHMLLMLRPNVNLPPHLFNIADEVADLGNMMVGELKDSPELTSGLRKLLEAKDCFVRCAVLDADPNMNSVDYRDR